MSLLILRINEVDRVIFRKYFHYNHVEGLYAVGV